MRSDRSTLGSSAMLVRDSSSVTRDAIPRPGLAEEERRSAQCTGVVRKLSGRSGDCRLAHALSARLRRARELRFRTGTRPEWREGALPEYKWRGIRESERIAVRHYFRPF